MHRWRDEWRHILTDSDWRVATLRNETELADLRNEWTALYDRALNAAPFASHDWIMLCWARHRDDRRNHMHVITVRRAGRLVLVAPLMTRPSWFGLHVLSWLDSKTPFYSDMLLEDSDDGLAAARLAAEALKSDRHLLRLRLNLVPQDAAAHHLLRHMTARQSANETVGVFDTTRCADAASFIGGLSQNQRRDYTRTQRALAAEGQVTLRTATTAAEIATTMTWLFAGKADRLQRRGKLGDWFTDPRTVELFTRACQAGLASGQCKLFLLELNGRLLAAELVFVGPRTYYLSKSYFHPGYPRVSLGTLLRLSIIIDAIDHGMTRIDFMLGTYEWKQRLKTSTISVGSFRVDGYYLARLRRR